MILKAFSSRHRVYIDDNVLKFTNMIYGEYVFVFNGGFDLHDDDTDEKIATVSGIFFDEYKILNEGEDIVELADIIDVDVYRAMLDLSKSKLHNQDLDENKAWLPLFSCYIERIYIYPKFRSRGLGRYIFENLEQIFLHCFNTYIHSFVIYPKPQQPDEKNGWINSPDADGSILKRMIDILKKTGYKKIGKSRFYAINCAI